MVPPSTDTTLIGYTANYVLYDTSGINSWNSTHNAWWLSEPEKPVTSDQIRQIQRHRSRKLTEAEMYSLRSFNIEPTAEGVRDCQIKHEEALSVLKTVPSLRARFDRRIPCWRSNRWKSLT